MIENLSVKMNEVAVQTAEAAQDCEPKWRTSVAKLMISAALLVYCVLGHAVGPFYVAGYGTKSCGVYLKDRKMQHTWSDGVYANWVMGFLAGVNLVRSELGVGALRGAEDPTVMAYLDKYCADNPLSNLTAAAIQLRDELMGGARGVSTKKP